MSALATIGLPHFLVVSAALFVLGLATVITRRNAVAILLGLELILNAAGINFVAFSHYSHGAPAGQIFTLFILLIAAAEAAIALAIVLGVFRHFHSIDAAATATLRE
jgi:NADH-quinone oxidoreductase subunit K